MSIIGHTRILVINPNITSSMTASLESPVNKLLSYHKNVYCDFFTAPPVSESSISSENPSILGAIPSINSPADAFASASYCLPFLRPLIPTYDGFLVACYSEHPLVHMLGKEIRDFHRRNNQDARVVPGKQEQKEKWVIGIFEASVIAGLGILAQYRTTIIDNDHDDLNSASRSEEEASFGIVSTGRIWEEALSKAVHSFLAGSSTTSSKRFAGVETTGLTATELHDLPADEVRSKMSDAAARLVSKSLETVGSSGRKRNVRVICLGCAGMTGLEGAVREGVIRALGDEEAREVKIVDGVIAGVNWLIGACRMKT
ncbi:putative DCG1-like protein [Dendrothele bispora CBS 962.96]|uniref:Putative DCG1-like protein n=1 Tax=Dendrothele bispora (strain CBS 962.96) TaxID=1314807 RepID=A0A4S8LFX6_DENBC|nr:putative DCG1-like protein [Dendrothele bispora CBS 962.96]